MKKRFVDIDPTLVTNSKAAELIHPRERSLDDPSMPSQSRTRLDTATCDPWRDPTLPRRSPTLREVVALVGVSLAWPLAQSASPALDRLDRVEHVLEQH